MGVWMFILVAVYVPHIIPKKLDQQRINRIHNGLEDTQRKFPYVVALVYALDQTSLYRGATGTAIQPRWIITAAHCIRDNLISIQYGNMSLTPNESRYKKRIIKRIVHPRYKMLGDGIWSINDVALLHVDAIQMKSYASISPVDLTETFGVDVIYAGFGIDNSNDSHALNNHQLLYYGKGFLTKCPGKVKRWTLSGYICVSSKHCSWDCQYSMPGDSGGALFHKDKLVGVLIGHCSEPVPVTAFTPLSQCLSWVLEVISAPYNDIQTK